MPVFSRAIFQIVHWTARHGLRDEPEPEFTRSPDRAFDGVNETKQESRRAGVRGETYAYWFLRNQGYVFVARNFMPRKIKGEIDLVGYDGKTLAFVEVRTRTVRDGLSALPELSVTEGKQRALVRTAQLFLLERRVAECPCRFDVVAIDNEPGSAPVVRLHKDAFSPQL